MKKLKELKRWLRSHARTVTVVTLSCGLVGFLLLYKLGSLTGGLSDSELQQQAFASSWRHIANNPLNLPLTGVQWLFLTIFSGHNQAVLRLGCAVFGALALLSFTYVLRRWYGVRTSLYGAILFGFSSWFLHVSRFAGPEVLYLWAVPTLLAIHIAWDRHHKQPLATFLAIAAFALLLYIPGMVWLVIISLGLQTPHLVAGWRSLGKPWQKVSVVILFLLLLAPLLAAIIKSPSLGQDWLGLPRTFANPNDIPRRFMQTISFLIWRGPQQPQLWLDRLPVLDVFSAAMGLLGTIFYAKHFQAPRTRLLFGLFVVGGIFYSLGGPVGFSALVPIAYLIITAGVGYMLHEWLHVFPRNPLARGIGFGLIGIVISLSCTYNLRAYFVAWPHSPTTTATFHNKL